MLLLVSEHFFAWHTQNVNILSTSGRDYRWLLFQAVCLAPSVPMTLASKEESLLLWVRRSLWDCIFILFFWILRTARKVSEECSFIFVGLIASIKLNCHNCSFTALIVFIGFSKGFVSSVQLFTRCLGLLCFAWLASYSLGLHSSPCLFSEGTTKKCDCCQFQRTWENQSNTNSETVNHSVSGNVPVSAKGS